MKQYWTLDPEVAFLNHGSFGSCPRAVLEFQTEIKMRLEREPVRFLVRELEPLADAARQAVAEFAGASPDNLVFVPNATHGVNTVLRSLHFQPGDELLVTDHEYNACRNALAFTAAAHGAKVVVAQAPFPVESEEQIAEAILSQVTSRTRLALIDHITSQTGLILPVAELIYELKSRGIETLIDGAHGPGMLPLRIEELGATYYTGNLHKWACGPKTAAFLHVQPERQVEIHPLSISHGWTTPRTDRSRFQVEFGWTGTWDPSAWLSVPEVLRFMGGLLPGGWAEIMERNHQLALAGRDILCQALEIPPPCPGEMIGSMASLPIPPARPGEGPDPRTMIDPLQERLWADDRIEVPVIGWPQYPKRLLRICAQLYNDVTQYERLAAALQRILFGRH